MRASLQFAVHRERERQREARRDMACCRRELVGGWRWGEGGSFLSAECGAIVLEVRAKGG